jgi:hypothetical protein
MTLNPPYQLLNAWTNLYETSYVYKDIWAHLNDVLHKSLPSVCVSVCVSVLSLLGKGSVKCIPLFVAGQRLGNHVPVATKRRNNRRIAVGVCLWVCLCSHLLLLGNNSVKTFPRQRRIVGGVVFYADRITLKENRRLVLPRTFRSSSILKWSIIHYVKPKHRFVERLLRDAFRMVHM